MKRRFSFGILRDHRASIFLFLLCWFAYFSAYLGRLNYSVALAGMVESGLFTKSDAGLIGMAYFLMYGFGQIISGFLGDRVSPFKMVFCGLLFSALCNLAMGLCGSYWFLVMIWGVNGAAQSMLWSPVLAVFANILQDQHRQKACIHISTTVPAGTLLSYLLSVWAMSCFGWSSVFFAAAVALGIAVVIWAIGSRWVIKRLEPNPHFVNSDPALETAAEKTPKVFPKKSLWGVLCMSGVLVMMFPIAVQGVLKDGVVTWVPTMITETFSVSPSFAVLLTMTLPFANLLGAYAGDFCNRKWFHNELTTTAAFFFLSFIALTGLFLAEGWSIWFSVLLLCVITFSMHAINVMIITFVPVHFSCFRKTSTISGLLNSTAYVGCAVSTYGIGYFAERIGWSDTILIWVGLCALGLILSLCVISVWKRFRKGVEESSGSFVG